MAGDAPRRTTTRRALGSLLGAAATGAALTACSTPAPGVPPAAVPTPGGVERVTYGQEPSQFAELLRPSGSPRGVVVVLHGGFWLPEYGLSLGRPLAEDLASRGWTALNVEYRRAGEGGGYLATLDDVSAAVDSLPGLGLDTGTVVALGHSAGGQLGAWAAGRRRLPRWAAASVAVTHVVAQAGVLDLGAAARARLGDDAVRGWLGGSPAEAPEAYASADPIRQVPLEVPAWCVHGTSDANVPVSQSRDYVGAAGAVGGEATLLTVDGDHFSHLDVTSSAWEAAVGVLDGIPPPRR